MKLVGILLIANALIITGWQVSTSTSGKGAISVCLIAVFVGLVLTFQDRITELSIKGVGTLKAVTEQAEAKLEQIESIRRRVESQGATIDLVAKDAKDARELTEEIKQKSEEVEKKVKEVDSAVADVNRANKELSELMEFTNAVVAAQTGDRKAFDKLKVWAESKEFRFKKEAEQAWIKILDDHSQGMYNTGYTVPWNAGVDPSKFDLNHLKLEYAQAMDSLKVPLIEYIWNRSDFSRKSRMQFLLDVMKTDSNLTTVEYAGRYFTQGANLKIKPLAVDYLAQWWSEHEQEIKD